MKALLTGATGVELIRGDVRDLESICWALDGCQSPAEDAIRKAIIWCNNDCYIRKQLTVAHTEV